MFKIEDNTIYITRGDIATIELSITGYTFKVNDKIEFRVYNKNGLDKSPVFQKNILVGVAGETINIGLTSEDTSIGSLINKPVEYWYEIELNDNQTVVGYDEDGAKTLILLPEGAEENE